VKKKNQLKGGQRTIEGKVGDNAEKKTKKNRRDAREKLTSKRVDKNPPPGSKGKGASRKKPGERGGRTLEAFSGWNAKT